MLNKLAGWQDTIVALATPPGVGAIGVIRLSGADAIHIADALFPAKSLEQQASHTLHVGVMREGDAMLDEVVVSLYKAPRSYTGENVVEISTHGSPHIQDRIIAACVRKGARVARHGEFTQRAFLNGKLDLTQAEAVADLIASATDAAREAALHKVKGGFSQVLKALREKLIGFSALIELELDFSQEDVEFADRTQLYLLIEEASHTTRALIDSFRLGNVIQQGVSVAIIGKPNAGKSTLLNTLLQDDRAIVSDIAGTTRDTIEETLNIQGVLFRLIDTAGIREHTHDVIEQVGMEKSLAKMRSADLVLYVFDAAQENANALRQIETWLQSNERNYLLIGNKADQLTEDQQQGWASFTRLYLISARDQLGMDALRTAMYQEAIHDPQGAESVVITNTRHQAALEAVYQSLNDIRHGLDQHISGDLLALDIRRCLHYISEITGDVTNEDVLDAIFSKFCIGK